MELENSLGKWANVESNGRIKVEGKIALPKLSFSSISFGYPSVDLDIVVSSLEPSRCGVYVVVLLSPLLPLLLSADETAAEAMTNTKYICRLIITSKCLANALKIRNFILATLLSLSLISFNFDFLLPCSSHFEPHWTHQSLALVTKLFSSNPIYFAVLSNHDSLCFRICVLLLVSV